MGNKGVVRERDPRHTKLEPIWGELGQDLLLPFHEVLNSVVCSNPLPPLTQSKSKKQKKPKERTSKKRHDDRNMARKQESVALITDHLSDVREKYHIQPKELGHGHYGVVRKCQERESGEWFAIKSIRKKKVGKIDVLKVRRGGGGGKFMTQEEEEEKVDKEEEEEE